jgi:protein TonB
VLLLYALPLFKEAQRHLPVKMTARLAAPKPPEPVTQRAEPPVAQPQPQNPAVRPPTAARTESRPAPLPQPVPRTAPILSVEPTKQAAEPAFVVPAAPAAPPPPAQQAPTARIEPQAAVQSQGGPEAGTVAQFRLELMDLARRYKRYPRVAQDNNWEGRVALRIAIAEDGAISSLVVTKGSGRVVLDDEAQAMIRTAKSKATIPAALRGKAFVIEIPVDFFLKEEK